MEKQDRGENSRKNEFSEDEKPFKKARYVWEVKGKHHLKDSVKNNSSSANSINEQQKPDEKKHKPCQTMPNTSINREQETSSTSKCCTEALLARTEIILDDLVKTDDVIMDSDEEEHSVFKKMPVETIVQRDVPVILVSRESQDQEYYLRKWQARQIVRGFIDNTINTVLETWINPPFNAADFVENCEDDGQLEDDAILMAIQSHGLQTGSRTRLNVSSADGANGESKTESSSRVIQPDIEEFALDNFQNYHREQENESVASSSNDSMSVDTNSSNSNFIESDINGDLEMGDPFDFLNAAVSVAIQKKGLRYS